MIRFIKQLFLPKAFNYSIHINGRQDQVFNGIKNISNWYLFDFHDLIYLYNEKVMETKHGRSILKLKCSDRRRQVAYSINNSTEGAWRFEINVQANPKGSVLKMKCWGPRKISLQTFHHRVTNLGNQLQRFKSLVEAQKI